MMTRFAVDQVVNADGVARQCTIDVEGGVVVGVTPGTVAGASGPFAIAVPGFIDMHTHGAAGADVMDGKATSFAKIARHHLRHGTTSFLGSTLTAPLEELGDVLRVARDAVRANGSTAQAVAEASILGIHLEGPWISPERAGAQNPAHMHAPDKAATAMIEEFADLIRMVTFSYHYRTADEFLDVLVRNGIIAACGHDSTTDERIIAGFARGLRHVTHLYSMTSSFGRVNGLKHLGTLEMALMTPGVKVEVIADGKHITEHFWRFITHNKGTEDIIIVSDSVRWTGLPDDPTTIHHLAGVDVVVDDGVAWLADRSAFAGSTATMHSMFRRLVAEWGVSLQDAVRMTSANQAAELGIDRSFGSIEAGKMADFVLLDEELEIVQVVKAGHAIA